ncbi:MAG: ABC transporter permease [Chloroflexia bacterium]|nr:ABC transporter permease [Chloroflexia bacterium]
MNQAVLTPEIQAADDAGDAAQPTRPQSFWRNFASNNKVGTAAIIVFFAILLLAFIGPFFVTGDNDRSRNVFDTPSAENWLGTDYMGRDVWYQIVHGGGSLLIVATSAAILSTAISVVFGALAAMFGGKFDVVVLTITDVFLTVPTIILLGVLAVSVRLNSPLLLALILAVTGWPTLLLAVRSQVLSLKEREYIEAARMLDLGTPRILFREVLPNMMSYIVINFVGGMTGAIYGQVILYFLGLVSLAGNNWGLMIQQGYAQGALFFPDAMWYIMSPIFMICVLQLSLVLISRSLEDVFNPRLRES